MTELLSPDHNGDMRYLLIASLLALGFGLYWPKYYSSLKQEGVLATIVSSKGTTEWVSRRSFKNLSPHKSTQIRINESIATGTDGELIIRFKKGAEIRLLPSSFITLTRKANSTLMALRRGDFDVLREGENNSLLISHKGQDKPLQDYQPPLESEVLLIDPQSLDTIKTVTMNSSIIPNSLNTQYNSGDLTGTHESISNLSNSTTAIILPSSSESFSPQKDDTPNLRLAKGPLSPVTEQDVKDFQTQIRSMISDRVLRQKNHFYRCYTTLIQKKSTNTIEGNVALHFTVNSYGKVEDSIITNSEIKDKIFQSCLLQVIKRTDFQPFHGPSISTLLPFHFDKNLQ